MELSRVDDAPPYDPASLVAVPLLDGTLSNVRLIRLGPGQRLPAHTHGESELMLYAVEGEGTLETGAAQHPFPAGSVACYPKGEELRVVNNGDAGLTLLAFLTPPFPPTAG